MHGATLRREELPYGRASVVKLGRAIMHSMYLLCNKDKTWLVYRRAIRKKTCFFFTFLRVPQEGNGKGHQKGNHPFEGSSSFERHAYE